jgi:hypothetical protein
VYGYNLFTKHPHPRDSSITKDENEHKYYVDWGDNLRTDKDNVSVTGMVNRYFPFDEKKVARDAAKRSKGKMTEEEFLRDWEEKRTQGIYLHELINIFYDEGGYTKVEIGTLIKKHPEFHQFILFHRHCISKENELGLVPFRSEWMIRTDQIHRIVGCVDMVYVITNKKVIINVSGTYDETILYLALFDWKRTKKVEISSYNKECGLDIFSDMDNCKHNRYALQLNLYKRILEEYYKDIQFNGKQYKQIKVLYMSLVLFHPENPNYQICSIDSLPDHINKLFIKRESEFCNFDIFD